jgi:hypothetical protein
MAQAAGRVTPSFAAARRPPSAVRGDAAIALAAGLA